MLVSALTVVAMAFRPLAGAWTDRYGARRVMLPGVLPLLVASLAFHVAATPAAFILLMALVGLGVGAITTAAGALVTRATAPAHRGEVLIVYTVFTHVPTALGPVVGSTLSALGGVELNFACVTALALATGVLICLLPRPAPPERGRGGGGLAFLRPRVRLAAGIVVMNLVGYASMFPFLPLHARAHGFGGIGWFFLLYSTLMVASRLFLRRLPDRLGRSTVIATTIGLLASAYLVMALPVTVTSLVTAAVLLAVGVSCYHPTLLAWVLDRTPDDEHGRVMGTVQASTDLGMAVGAAVTGFIVQHTASYGAGFAVAGGVALAALITFVSVAAWLDGPGRPRPAPV
jgi:MFS family permease